MSDFATSGFLTGLAVSAAVLVVVFGVTLVVARRIGRWAVVDVTWGLSFAAVALTSLGWSQGRSADGARQLLIAAMVCVWGIRLAAYIGMRSRGKGEDPRYAAMFAKAEGSPVVFALKKVFIPQAVISYIVSIPVQIAMYERSSLGPVAWVGLAVWTLGLFFESVGDAQMAAFRSKPDNAGQVMDRGLWRYTRHPNYFGDTCIWIGAWFVAAQQWQGLAAIASPALMFYFLYFASGKALLERMMARRKPGYAEYMERTSGFLPLPPKKQRATPV
jgi:steroid 5-alpha reductase family enzyme